MGSMMDFIARTGVECHSIEIVPDIHARAAAVLSRYKNVILHLGDSGDVIPRLLQTLESPATFWLDGHYSGSFTGRGTLDSPISDELYAIISHPIKKHVILIDDARMFNGQDGYPPLSTVLTHFEENRDYKAEVSTDIIRILPR
jgi:hypothetical protein